MRNEDAVQCVEATDIARPAPAALGRLLSIVCLACGLVCSIGAHAEELVLLNWSDYFPPALKERFEAENGVTVREVFFESDQKRDGILAEEGGAGFDVVVLNGDKLGPYRALGWLRPLSEEQVPNLRHMEERWRDIHPSGAGYALPLFWGTLGIAYRADLVESPPDSWWDLLRPSDALCGRIMMNSDGRDLISIALKANGLSVNSTDARDIELAAHALELQKPCVKEFGFMDINSSADMVKGTVVAATMYNGDAVKLREFHQDIRFAHPVEGSVMWVDYLAIMAAARNPELAARFLNFIYEPENLVEYAEWVYYPTTNAAAEARLSETFKGDPGICPPVEVRDALEVERTLNVRATRVRNRVVSQLMSD